VTEQDKAVLVGYFLLMIPSSYGVVLMQELKNQRDKLKKYQNKVSEPLRCLASGKISSFHTALVVGVGLYSP
jgi:hypothetical protein